jgi:hypothetical protein
MREENATARINKRGRFKVVERWGLLARGGEETGSWSVRVTRHIKALAVLINAGNRLIKI